MLLKEMFSYPIAVWLILFSELCERFAYYAFKTILPMYLTDFLGYSSTFSLMTFHSFICLAYATPIIGGMIADAKLGKYWTILLFSCLYFIGQIGISLTAGLWHHKHAFAGLIVGLLLVGIGNGGIKSCVATLGGDQFVTHAQKKQCSSYFALFYLTINVGSLFSVFISPLVRNWLGYWVAFLIPAVLLFGGTFLFAVGKKLYVVNPTDRLPFKLIGVVYSAIKHRKDPEYAEKKSHWLSPAQLDGYKKGEIDAIYKALQISVILLVSLSFYWSLYDQHATRFVFQGKKMNKNFGLFKIKADQMQFLNPLLILIAVPFFDQFVYPCFKSLTPLRKIGIGFWVIMFSFLYATILEVFVEIFPNKVHITAQIPQMILMCVSEALVAVTALQFAYEESPKALKSVMTGIYLLPISIGNMIVVLSSVIPIIPEKVKFKQVYEFLFFIFLMFIGWIFFVVVIRNYKYAAEETVEKVLNEGSLDALLENTESESEEEEFSDSEDPYDITKETNTNDSFLEEKD